MIHAKKLTIDCAILGKDKKRQQTYLVMKKNGVKLA